ncbi:MAG: effector-associated domain EAD1-containing protein, partial [Cyanobacteria bacterium J06635_10]
NLQRRLEKRKYEIECELSFEKVDVRKLIDDANLWEIQKTQLEKQLENERNSNLQLEEKYRQQREKIFKAIINAYLNKNDLQIMIDFRLGENLDSIAGGKDMQEIVFNLIQWAQSQGKLKLLVQAAREYKPGNTQLKNIDLDGL